MEGCVSIGHGIIRTSYQNFQSENFLEELLIKTQFDNVNVRSSPGSWSAVDAVTPAHEVAAGPLHSIKK